MKILIIGSTSVFGDILVSYLKKFGEIKTAGRRQADIFFDLESSDQVPKVDEFLNKSKQWQEEFNKF
ncbi:MAG: hypothetical protein K2P90_00960 [Holosporales bacterium]|nr:hypothetical protein [Holosporales bacterium]